MSYGQATDRGGGDAAGDGGWIGRGWRDQEREYSGRVGGCWPGGFEVMTAEVYLVGEKILSSLLRSNDWIHSPVRLIVTYPATSKSRFGVGRSRPSG